MTPGLLRPLTKSFDNSRGNNNNNNSTSTTTVNKSPHFESQHHFSWLHKKHHYSPVAQQQQQQQQLQQHHVPVSFNRPSGERRKALTLGSWGNNLLPGKALLFDKLAKLKKKTSQNATTAATTTPPGHNGKGLLFSGPQMSTNSHVHHSMSNNDDPLIVVCDFCTSSSSSSAASSTSTDVKEPEWLSGEKSVRFSLPESKRQVDPEEREDYWGYYQPPVNEIEKGHFSNSINRRREKLYHDDLQLHSHLHNNNNNFCTEHPIRRNLSFGEGLNDSLMTYHQYPPEPSSCIPCWCNGHGAPPIMMMPPPSSCSSHCCPMQQQQQRMLQCHHQNPFEERFSQYPSPHHQVRSNKSELSQS